MPFYHLKQQHAYPRCFCIKHFQRILYNNKRANHIQGFPVEHAKCLQVEFIRFKIVSEHLLLLYFSSVFLCVCVNYEKIVIDFIFIVVYLSVDVKVHLNPKYIFRLNKSLHLFETHFAFLNLILTFF